MANEYLFVVFAIVYLILSYTLSFKGAKYKLIGSPPGAEKVVEPVFGKNEAACLKLKSDRWEIIRICHKPSLTHQTLIGKGI